MQIEISNVLYYIVLYCISSHTKSCIYKIELNATKQKTTSRHFKAKHQNNKKKNQKIYTYIKI